MNSILFRPTPFRPIRSGAAFAAALWLTTVGGGLYWLERYEAAAGAKLVSPAAWPADTGLKLVPHRLTLVLALHPRCPCSRVTVAHLADLLARHPDRVSATILLYHPEAEPADADVVAGLPIEATVIRDPEARLAQQFGAVTSGHVLLFRADGGLAFSGGLTRGRGQEGDNPGRQALLRCLEGADGEPLHTAVFGCPLTPPSGS
ncbi:MAG: RedB protein [Planctomycetia bacterium]|nr:RedB protein [Planctomycetia bacterium]